MYLIKRNAGTVPVGIFQVAIPGTPTRNIPKTSDSEYSHRNSSGVPLYELVDFSCKTWKPPHFNFDFRTFYWSYDNEIPIKIQVNIAAFHSWVFRCRSTSRSRTILDQTRTTEIEEKKEKKTSMYLS